MCVGCAELCTNKSYKALANKYDFKALRNAGRDVIDLFPKVR